MRARKILAVAAAASLALGLAACSDAGDADRVNENLAKDADNFQVVRRVVFVNGITDKNMLLVEGYCSIETDNPNRWAVTCQTGKNSKGEPIFVRHFMGKSDNVTMISEQMVGAQVSPNHYVVNYKPSALIPDVNIR